MDDKEKKTEGEETKEETPPKTAPATEDSKDGEPKGKSPLEEAKEINAKKEELLDREEKLTERKEKLEAARIVGGQTEAGQTPETKEETDEELAEKFDKGEVDILEKE